MKNAQFLEVSAGVRYWDDAELNGVADSDGKIPLREGELWSPTIELLTGRILDWPEGTTADIHYKVCDDGNYWLLDESRKRIAKWKGFYVPDDILCIGDRGHGDYIILRVGENGVIVDWEMPELDAEEWEPV